MILELLNKAISLTGDTVVDKQASFVIEKSTRNSAAIPSVKEFYDKLLKLVKGLGYKTLHKNSNLIFISLYFGNIKRWHS